MQRLRLDDNPSGVTFDVEATASCPLFVETPYVHYRYGRVLNHLIRYSGSVRATGTATVLGTEVPVDNWYGGRDHSSGIRSSMGPHVPIGGAPEAEDDSDRRALRLWVPFETDRYSGSSICTRITTAGSSTSRVGCTGPTAPSRLWRPPGTT